MQQRMLKKRRFTPVQVLVIGFALVILVGALILMLPISSNSGTVTPFVDCLFTSTTSVCVTGLVTVDTGSHWSYFGKTVIMLLIETGGLGFMSFATLVALLFGKRITLKERLVMAEAMNAFSIQGVVKMVKYVLFFTVTVQGIGALLLATQFVPEFGFWKGLYYGIFHSVSAFCNAGIDLFGTPGNEFVSIVKYQSNSVIILTIGALIVIGGLGFTVWQEIYYYRGMKKMSLHSRLAIVLTAIFIIGGAILMFAFEYNNPGTMKGMDFKTKTLSSLFASITPRTAGYNSIPTADMSVAGRFLTVILMFIGAAPGSTGGGIKVTTFGLLVMAVISVIRGKEDTEIFKKRIGRDLVYRGLAIATISLTLVIVVTMILSTTEAGASLEYLLYETTSAFGTVGLTLGLTPKLSLIGKYIIIFTMYCGRLGVLTIAMALANKTSSAAIKYPEDKILIG